MKSDDRIEKISRIAERIADFTGVRLVRVEYVKEGGRHILRVIISREGGTGTKECVEMSRALSKKLDEIDVIKEQYFLEVSSPGIESESPDSID